MYMRNKRGPRIDPCRTPALIWSMVDWSTRGPSSWRRRLIRLHNSYTSRGGRGCGRSCSGVEMRRRELLEEGQRHVVEEERQPQPDSPRSPSPPTTPEVIVISNDDDDDEYSEMSDSEEDRRVIQSKWAPHPSPLNQQPFSGQPFSYESISFKLSLNKNESSLHIQTHWIPLVNYEKQ